MGVTSERAPQRIMGPPIARTTISGGLPNAPAGSTAEAVRHAPAAGRTSWHAPWRSGTRSRGTSPAASRRATCPPAYAAQVGRRGPFVRAKHRLSAIRISQVRGGHARSRATTPRPRWRHRRRRGRRNGRQAGEPDGDAILVQQHRVISDSDACRAHPRQPASDHRDAPWRRRRPTIVLRMASQRRARGRDVAPTSPVQVRAIGGHARRWSPQLALPQSRRAPLDMRAAEMQVRHRDDRQFGRPASLAESCLGRIAAMHWLTRRIAPCPHGPSPPLSVHALLSSSPPNNPNCAGPLRLGEAHVPEGVAGEQAPARGALQEALLDQIGLDDVLDGVARLRQRRRDGLDAHRAAAEFDARSVVEVLAGPSRRGRPASTSSSAQRPVGDGARHRLRRRRRWRSRARGAAAARRCAACRAPAGRSRWRPPAIMPMPSTRAPRATISSSSSTV